MAWYSSRLIPNVGLSAQPHGALRRRLNPSMPKGDADAGPCGAGANRHVKDRPAITPAQVQMRAISGS